MSCSETEEFFGDQYRPFNPIESAIFDALFASLNPKNEGIRPRLAKVGIRFEDWTLYKWKGGLILAASYIIKGDDEYVLDLVILDNIPDDDSKLDHATTELDPLLTAKMFIRPQRSIEELRERMLTLASFEPKHLDRLVELVLGKSRPLV